MRIMQCIKYLSVQDIPSGNDSDPTRVIQVAVSVFHILTVDAPWYRITCHPIVDVGGRAAHDTIEHQWFFSVCGKGEMDTAIRCVIHITEVTPISLNLSPKRQSRTVAYETSVFSG